MLIIEGNYLWYDQSTELYNTLDFSKPQLVAVLENHFIIQASQKYDFVLCLTKEGKVFSWGWY
jgi:alpha-tubulin suppressor-like RCC1 family protein